MPDAPRYDEDFYAWTQHQAAVPRSMEVADNRFDREKIEDLGKGQRDAARSQIRRILGHLLKLAHSPAAEPHFDWMGSIAEARAAFGDKLSPALRHDAKTMLARLYRDGRRRAALALRGHGEERVAERLPADSPYTVDQILLDDWYPDPEGDKQ